MISISIPEYTYLGIEDLSPVKGKYGIYVIMDKLERPLYVGKGDLYARLYQHIKSRETSLFRHYIASVKYFEIEHPLEREIYETYLINEIHPPFNRAKVYCYNSYSLMNKYTKENKPAWCRN